MTNQLRRVLGLGPQCGRDISARPLSVVGIGSSFELANRSFFRVPALILISLFGVVALDATTPAVIYGQCPISAEDVVVGPASVTGNSASTTTNFRIARVAGPGTPGEYNDAASGTAQGTFQNNA